MLGGGGGSHRGGASCEAGRHGGWVGAGHGVLVGIAGAEEAFAGREVGHASWHQRTPPLAPRLGPQHNQPRSAPEPSSEMVWLKMADRRGSTTAEPSEFVPHRWRPDAKSSAQIEFQ